MNNLALNLPIPDAWNEDIIPHGVQDALVTDDVRFKTIPAGRRSGKTFRFKRYLSRYAMSVRGQYFAGAPIRAQAKKIFWEDFGKLLPPWYQRKPPSLSDLIYYLSNGSEIHIVGLDEPSRIEGVPWKGGGIDEFGNCKPNMWDGHIRPSLSTRFPDGHRAWCWLFGVPEGLNDYYDLCEYALNSGDEDWKDYRWFSSDILSDDEILAVKRQMSARQFRQEYEASFEGATGRVYDDYTKANHSTKVFNLDMPIHWTHDFNFVPLSSAVIQIYGEGNNAKAYVVDEIVIDGAVAKNSAIEFVEKFKGFERCPVFLYGDASGIKGEKHGIESEYITIQKYLQQKGFTVHKKYPRSNPAIKDGQNSLRARVLNANNEKRFFVNPVKAKTADKGLLTVQFKKGSAFQEEESRYQHITTALRYFTNVLWPIKAVSEVKTVQAVQYG